ASSKAIVGIGAIGDASIIKIATNMVTAASVQGAAEAMAIVHYSGIPLEKFADALKQNASNSATLDLKVPRIISADFDPHFSVKHMLKDMQIANRMGRHFDLDLTVAGATRDRLLDEAQQGRGDDDFSSIARRFLPFVQGPDLAERQPDLFSPRPVAVPHEVARDRCRSRSFSERTDDQRRSQSRRGGDTGVMRAQRQGSSRCAPLSVRDT